VSRILYFDCASGVAGDMLLGALVDLGLPIETLREALATLPLAGYRIESSVVRRGSLQATKVDVVIEGEAGHGHGHHHHRGLKEILGILDQSGLDTAVKERAAGLFRRLAEVEAAAHGTTIDKVHFHEVGAVDSIVDIVGGVFGLAWLKAERFCSSPLNLGSGTVTTAHGTLPVPAPATARLVEGVPVYGAGDGELTTPTGALLVTGHAQRYGPLPLMRIEKTGYGAGGRETPGRPNLLRLIVGEGEGERVDEGRGDRVLVMETEIDDMSPQLYGPLMERLLAAGAFDAYYTPIVMKKGRPGIQVTVLTDAARRGVVEEILFSETTTIGVRRQEWDRSCLAREIVTVATAYGSIRVKRALAGARTLNAQPEFDDCERAAKQAGVAVKEVWAATVTAYRNQAEKEPNNK
jgi:pyridinium-3,5-bisthiocarboxylic acid mononucleotide nickel chelatase